MGAITVVGVGYGPGQLTENAEKALLSGAAVLLHTDRCPCAAWLRERGVPFTALDELYEAADDFDAHARAAAERVRAAAAAGDVVYGVLDVRDRSVLELMQLGPVTILPGPPAEDVLLARAAGATLCLEASDWENFSLQAEQNVLVREIDSRALAAEVKLKLMERYPEESVVYVRRPEGGLARTELYKLDRLQAYDHRTSAFVPACADLPALERFGLAELERLVRRLYGPDGCPWDRKQTHASLRASLIEEAYEVADAIDRDDGDALIEELGDLLFVALLHVEIGRAHGDFTLDDVASGIARKMIRRHPHVFAGEGTADEAEIDASWQEIKRREHGFASRTDSMRAVARALPALVRAEKVLERAESSEALRRAAAGERGGLGERLLALVSEAVQAGVSAEEALMQATEDFIAGFSASE